MGTEPQVVEQRAKRANRRDHGRPPVVEERAQERLEATSPRGRPEPPVVEQRAKRANRRAQGPTRHASAPAVRGFETLLRSLLNHREGRTPKNSRNPLGPHTRSIKNSLPQQRNLARYCQCSMFEFSHDIHRTDHSRRARLPERGAGIARAAPLRPTTPADLLTGGGDLGRQHHRSRSEAATWIDRRR